MSGRKIVALALIAAFAASLGTAGAIALGRDGHSSDGPAVQADTAPPDTPAERERGQQKIPSRIDAEPYGGFQAALLADGEVTEAEYDQAFAAYRECVTKAGGEILGPGTRTKYGVYDFTLGFPPVAPGVANTEAREAAANCGFEYWDVVSQRWQLTHMAPRSAYDEAMATVPGCMKEHGVTPPDDLSRGWGERYLESGPPHDDGMVLLNCAKEAAQAAGLGTQVLILP